jgi:hypothetical protein
VATTQQTQTFLEHDREPMGFKPAELFGITEATERAVPR